MMGNIVNYISDKGLESRVCKDLSQHPIIREQIIQLKMNKRVERRLHQKQYIHDNKCSASLVIEDIKL